MLHALQWRLGAGDELQLKHTCSGKDNKPWQDNGIVIKLADAHEEVALELRAGAVCLHRSLKHLPE